MAEDFLEEVDQGGDEGQQILNVIRDSYLDSKFDSTWKSVRVELVKNKHLDAEFDEKKQDFLIRGRKSAELEENFGFMAESNVAAVETIAAVGLQSHESDYNPLGYARLGTYVCKHADICLQHALLKNPSSQVLRVIVAKYITGRNTTAIPRSATASEFIEPTQGYDSHTSALPPSLNDPLQTQYDRSQVYLYEINKLLQPSLRPRQALPYAVVTFTENGLYLPEVDAKPTAKEKLAGNPRLQEIIKAINSKKSGSKGSGEGSVTAQEKTGVGILQGPSIECGGQGGGAASCGGLKGHPSVTAATGMPVTVGNGLKPMNGMINGNGIKAPSEADRSSQLHMIISQINSKMDNNDPGVAAAAKGALPGRSSACDGLLGSAPIVVTAANGTYPSSNGTYTNGSLGSGSPLGSRPGSAESMLSAQAMNHQPVAQKASIFTAGHGLASQRFNFLHSDSVKGQQALGHTVMPSLPPQLSLGLPSQGYGAHHHPHSAIAQQMAAGYMSRKELLDLNSAIPAGFSGALPFSVYPNHPALQTQHFMHSLASQDQLRTSLPQYASFAPYPSPTFSTANLSQIPQSPGALLLRPGTAAAAAAFKRAFPDPSSIGWDKRPKLF